MTATGGDVADGREIESCGQIWASWSRSIERCRLLKTVRPPALIDDAFKANVNGSPNFLVNGKVTVGIRHGVITGRIAGLRALAEQPC